MPQIRRFQYETAHDKYEDYLILNEETTDEEAFDRYGRNQDKKYRIFYGLMDWEKFDINKIKKEIDFSS